MEQGRVMKSGALAGVRIVDFTWERSGPQATRIFAMMGAEVIRLEWTGAPDSGRRPSPRTTPKGITPGVNTNGDFNNFSCNKLSIILNARDPQGRETLKRLIAVSDIVIENYSSRVLESWGFDYETQKKANPSIIYLSMAGFGHSGRWRDYDTWGPGNQALAGLTFLAGVPGKPPSGYGESYMDHTAGYYGAMALLTALHHRNLTGQGQYLDLAQVEVGCTHTGAALLDYTVNKRPTRREGIPCGSRTYWPGAPLTNSYKGRHAAPHNAYQTAGGGHWDWCVIACETETEWLGLRRVMGDPAWAKEEKLANTLGRLLNQEDLDKRINEWTVGFGSKYELVEKLQAAGVPAAPVNGTRDRVERDPQLKHRGTFATRASHPVIGDRPFEGLPMKMSATPWEIWRHAPLLDQDKEYVLGELVDAAKGPVEGPKPAGAGTNAAPAARTKGATALADLRVLEVGDITGQFCGKLLADMGADVIKIEPPSGSDARHIGPFQNDVPDRNRSLYFWHYNTSKRGITLDLDTAAGQTTFLALAQRADVVLESNTPGVMAARGLGYEQVKRVNPNVIYCSLTPYGQDGPYARYKANDLCLMAAGGQMGVSGYDKTDDPLETPVAPSGGNALHTGNNYAYCAILAAVLYRDRTGAGQYIDVSIQESVAICTEGAFVDYIIQGEERRRQTGRHAGYAPSPQVQYRCADGRYVNCLTPKLGPKEWKSMVEWFKSKGLQADLEDPKYLDAAEMQKAMPHILKVVQDFAAHVTAEEMMHGGQARKLPWAMVRAPSELLDDPHLQDRKFFVPVEHPEAGRSFAYPGAPYIAQATPWRIRRRAPLLGEDNVEVYEKELGMPRERLAALAELGVI